MVIQQNLSVMNGVAYKALEPLLEANPEKVGSYLFGEAAALTTADMAAALQRALSTATSINDLMAMDKVVRALTGTHLLAISAKVKGVV